MRTLDVVQLEDKLLQAPGLTPIAQYVRLPNFCKKKVN